MRAIAVIVLGLAGAAGFGLLVARRGEPLGWIVLAGTVIGAVTATPGRLGIAAAAFGLHGLVGWPADPQAVVLGTAAVLPLSLLAGAVPSVAPTIDGLLIRTISLAGVVGVVVGVYLAIVLGLGRVPKHSERTLLVLSMVAAAVAVLLYFPAHRRLTDAANRLVYGQRHAPDDAIRQFGSRMSRAIPLDELLLQVTESLRRTFDLRSAEVWTASGERLQLAASDP